jgi:hypothetical protein
LFEGFVVDRWKLPGEAAFSDGAHAWDALTTAVGFHYAKRGIEEERLLSLIHEAGRCKIPTISHWETILNSLKLDVSRCKSDCMVVGFDSQSATLIRDAKQNFAGSTKELSLPGMGTESFSSGKRNRATS